MKSLVTSALALCLIVMIGCAEGTSPSPSVDFANATNRVDAAITGMDCAGCKGQVESAVAGIEGVEGVYACLKSGEVTVALAEGIDAEATKAQVEEVIVGLSDGKYAVTTIAASTAGHACADGSCEMAAKTACADGSCELAKAECADGACDMKAGQTEFAIAGMTCEACSTKLTAALTELDCVGSAYVCHKSGKATLTAAEGHDYVCSALVTKAVEEAGFTVSTEATSCEKGACEATSCEGGACEMKTGECSEGACELKADADTSDATEFVITGMTCEACSTKLTTALTELDCVGSAYVCHKSGKATLTAAEGHAYVCPGLVAQTVKDAGFEVVADAE